MDEHRTLTDADVEAIVANLRKSIVAEFYSDLGRGFWAWVKKGIFIILLSLAVYGATRNFDLKLP